jgi:hypothetical protein
VTGRITHINRFLQENRARAVSQISTTVPVVAFARIRHVNSNLLLLDIRRFGKHWSGCDLEATDQGDKDRYYEACDVHDSYIGVFPIRVSQNSSSGRRPKEKAEQSAQCGPSAARGEATGGVGRSKKLSPSCCIVPSLRPPSRMHNRALAFGRHHRVRQRSRSRRVDSTHLCERSAATMSRGVNVGAACTFHPCMTKPRSRLKRSSQFARFAYFRLKCVRRGSTSGVNPAFEADKKSGDRQSGALSNE